MTADEVQTVEAALAELMAEHMSSVMYSPGTGPYNRAELYVKDCAEALIAAVEARERAKAARLVEALEGLRAATVLGYEQAAQRPLHVVNALREAEQALAALKEYEG